MAHKELGPGIHMIVHIRWFL